MNLMVIMMTSKIGSLPWLVGLSLLVGCGGSVRTVVGRSVGSDSCRTLVVIIPSVITDDTTWAEPIDGEPNFASEVLSHAPVGTDLLPIHWPQESWKRPLAESAELVVGKMQPMLSDYDQIVMVGHSHGGNLALLAAGMCSERINQVICISTPHVFLQVESDSQESSNIPVFCTKRTRENTDVIVTISASGDEVSNTWANLFTTGTPRDEAVRLCQGWLDELRLERPGKTALWQRMIKGDDLYSSDFLSLANDHFLVELSPGSKSVNDVIGILPHTRTHDAEMGRDVGKWLSQKENRWQTFVQ